MIDKPKIAILCAGKSAFQAIQLLALENYLAGIAICGNEATIAEDLITFCTNSQIPFLSIGNKEKINTLSQWLIKIKADAAFCIGFPYKITPEVMSVLPGKFINFHMGALPEYRGPMPIFETLKAGEKETALTVHKMNENFDEGNIVFTERLLISDNETFGSLAIKFTEQIALAAQNLAQMLQFGSVLPSTLQERSSSYHYFPGRKDTLIRWNYMSAEEVTDLCNACNPWNIGADTSIQLKHIKIISAIKTNKCHNNQTPGTIVSIRPDFPVSIACIDDEILDVTIVSSDWGIESAYTLFNRIAKTGTILGNHVKHQTTV